MVGHAPAGCGTRPSGKPGKPGQRTGQRTPTKDAARLGAPSASTSSGLLQFLARSGADQDWIAGTVAGTVACFACFGGPNVGTTLVQCVSGLVAVSRGTHCAPSHLGPLHPSFSSPSLGGFVRPVVPLRHYTPGPSVVVDSSLASFSKKGIGDFVVNVEKSSPPPCAGAKLVGQKGTAMVACQSCTGVSHVVGSGSETSGANGTQPCAMGTGTMDGGTQSEGTSKGTTRKGTRKGARKGTRKGTRKETKAGRTGCTGCTGCTRPTRQSAALCAPSASPSVASCVVQCFPDLGHPISGTANNNKVAASFQKQHSTVKIEGAGAEMAPICRHTTRTTSVRGTLCGTMCSATSTPCVGRGVWGLGETSARTTLPSTSSATMCAAASSTNIGGVF